MGVSSGEANVEAPAPERRRRPVAAAIYEGFLVAIASFGFGRAWEPLVATYDNFWQAVSVFDATRNAFATALRANATEPHPLAELPHAITVYPILALRRQEQGDVVL